MVHLIDKNALVAEIYRMLLIYTKRYAELTKHEVWITAKEIENRIQGLKEALSILNTLEVKDVDLIKEVANWKIDHQVYGMDETWYDFAEYFYKLGLKSQKGK